MKRFSIGSAVMAGILGTLAMTALMYMAPLMGLPKMDLIGAWGKRCPSACRPTSQEAWFTCSMGSFSRSSMPWRSPRGFRAHDPSKAPCTLSFPGSSRW